MNPFLNSPYFAMAGQAINNLSNMGMGGGTVSPVQAYQQAVAEKQQRALMEQRQLPTSYREWQLARQGGYEGSYEDWIKVAKPNTMPSQVQSYLFRKGLSPDEQAQFDLQRRGATVRELPDGSVVLINPDGTQRVIASAQQSQTGAEAMAGAAQRGEEGVKFAYDQGSEAWNKTLANREGFNVAQQMIDIADSYITSLDTGELTTGPIDAFLMNYFGIGSSELAQMEADAVEQMLNNLQITNLAPVTIQELKTIAKLWAQAARQETPNRALLERAKRKAQRLQKSLEEDTVLQGGRIQEYLPTDYERMRRINPFLNRIMEANEPITLER